MTQEELRKISEVQIELMDEVHRICIKNNIRYYMAYGTLLGAVRHKGYIPWDFDIDVVMPRADYERFKQVCKKQLSDPYGYLDMDSVRNYMRPHALIVHKGTKVTYKYDHLNPKPMELGVYIDIFPLDNAPDDAAQRQRHAKKIRSIQKFKDRRLMYCHSFVRWRRYVHYAAAALLSFIPVSAINRYQQAQMQKYNGKETRQVCSMSGGYAYEKECMPKEIFGNPVLLEFEGRSFYAPENYTEFLTRIYGDYMQLPPEEKRQKNLGYFTSFKRL